MDKNLILAIKRLENALIMERAMNRRLMNKENTYEPFSENEILDAEKSLLGNELDTGSTALEFFRKTLNTYK
ncbi:MAG: hypothetical protein KIT80_23410 [Chitinophagaceae bacterium]|nr:hypothetical protein [Nitrosomonas sp.]MCW5929888.1 hypothetical protein [Chitinophagaceae bacterium]